MAVVSVAIESIAAGGDGVGRNEGLVVFVPRTAPGDVVTAQISGRAHFARGSLRSIVTASPVRIDPPCLHYTRDRCGGCQLQHMTYESQLAAKQIIIRDSFQRIGKRSIDPPEIERSPEEWRYRTKLTLAMRRRGARWIAGLHPYDDPVRVFPLSDCPITDRRVVAAWREVMDADAYFPDAKELRG
ncbi:MAG TPA: TRAM domain-containing protein, partial [Gemmatimonadaceae bacterium]|nr:TRAM domain-containing protein [Gemmatimonadaceae bacterium]